MKKVLFLCTGNSCRSQMAEGFLREAGKGEFESFSAGTFPKDQIHPLAIKAMKEKGIDIQAQHPKNIDQFLNQDVDLVITVCDNAKQSCPTFPNQTEMMSWSFEDPADATGSEEEQMAVFRKIRDQIEGSINKLVGHLQKELS